MGWDGTARGTLACTECTSMEPRGTLELAATHQDRARDHPWHPTPLPPDQLYPGLQGSRAPGLHGPWVLGPGRTLVFILAPSHHSIMPVSL